MTGHVHGNWVLAASTGGPTPGILALGLDSPRRPWPGPLICAGCGAPWPCEPLPDPAHEREGYGDLGEWEPWRRRVRNVIHDLSDVA